MQKDKQTISHIRLWLNNIRIEDPTNRQMAYLLQVMLVGIVAIIVVSTIINLFFLPLEYPWYVVVTQSILISLIFILPLILLRRGYLRTSVTIIIAIFLLLVSTSILRSNLRALAENLTFYTFAIFLAGLLINRKALILTLAISSGVIIFSAVKEVDPVLRLDYIIIAGNFILLNGLMGVFISYFGVTLRNALKSSIQREDELTKEVAIREQAEDALKQSNERLEILHEIDRALLSAQSLHDIAKAALVRIRKLIPCERASVTLFNFEKQEAAFLTADFDGMETIPDTPIGLDEYGLDVIERLLQNKAWSTDDILTEKEVTELDKRLVNEYGIHIWLSLPLFYQGQLIGALNLGRISGKPFHREDAEVAHEVANQLAIALQQTRLYDALQYELVERERLIAKLEASNAELERFTYTVSHDLRSPLVTIRGFLGMLNKDLHENRFDNIQDDFQRIAGATDKMEELLSDLLELSRIGRIINPPQEVDLTLLIQDAIDSVEARLRSKQVTVNIAPELPIVYGDRIRLREVFENLIDNAVKYMGDQTDPVIEIGLFNRDNKEVLFIRDNGIGIEERYQNKIFGLFEKLDPTVEGTGIGLALVKRIIESHGGKIWVDSEGPGKGSTFCFTIPDSRNEIISK